MMLQMFSVRDKAVGNFLPPFFSRSKGEAVRSFADACNQPDHQFKKHADDYSLWFLGEWDDQGATFRAVDPVRILLAVECYEGAPIESVQVLGSA